MNDYQMHHSVGVMVWQWFHVNSSCNALGWGEREGVVGAMC